MDNKERTAIIAELDSLLSLLNSAKDYNLTFLKRLSGLEKRIKKFAVRNTKIDKDILKIYRKFSPSIYFITVYSATRDFEQALSAYKMTELYGGFIQYIDLFYEHPKNEQFKKLAYKFRADAIKGLNQMVRRELLWSEEKFVAKYGKMEIKYKKLLQLGHEFNDSEIEDFMLLKAKSIVCYPIILKQYCNMSQNLINLINYNQAIYNFYDDYWDLKEDLDDKAPNSFIFCLLTKDKEADLCKLTRRQLIVMIRRKKVWLRLEKIANRFRIKAEKIFVPAHYRFWHFLPRFNYEFFKKYF